MQSLNLLNQLETEPIPIEEEEKRHSRRLLVGVLCALIFTGTVLGGYLYLRKRHERQLAAAAAELDIKKKTPQVEVFVDDATVNGKTSLLGGTIHNISGEPLHNLAIELQLRRRAGGGIETRAVTPETSELAPDGRTRYSLEVPVQDYVSVTFLGVVGGEARAKIPFKALPGAPRPPMDAPASKTIIVNRPVPKGEEFINSPNNPGRVP
jgi:hypothetical protein